ncbi:hypothetical protein [Flavobacterium sp. Arc2]|uniref:hypothetical protein n=1 Tax=Flavobacterium sp. Arc2 TaxID=3046685 RepID=UPI00352E2D40
METIKTPQSDIEAFLYDEINIEILEYLISLKYTGRLEPLEYFNLLFSEFDFFIKNSSNYLKITERFVFPNIDELDIFEIKAINNSIIVAGLTKLISKHIYSVDCNEVIRKSCKYITKINDFIIDYGYKDSIRHNDFDIVKQHYKDLEYSVQIEKWTNSKFDILQGKREHYFSKDEAKSFVENIDFEIQRLKDLIENKKELMTTSKIGTSSTDLFNKNMLLEFSYDNNFDHVPKEKVYNYFKTELVDKNHLSLDHLHEYLIMAFQEKKPPNEKLKLRGSLGIGIIKNIFYRYYDEIAQDKHGLKYNYCQLLGEYFNGFDTDKLSRNFDK